MTRGESLGWLEARSVEEWCVACFALHLFFFRELQQNNPRKGEELDREPVLIKGRFKTRVYRNDRGEATPIILSGVAYTLLP